MTQKDEILSISGTMRLKCREGRKESEAQEMKLKADQPEGI